MILNNHKVDTERDDDEILASMGYKQEVRQFMRFLKIAIVLYLKCIFFLSLHEAQPRFRLFYEFRFWVH